MSSDDGEAKKKNDGADWIFSYELLTSVTKVPLPISQEQLRFRKFR